MNRLIIFLSVFLISCSGREVITTDICIYGATSAGVISACAASLLGKQVVLADASGHIGGLSSGGLGQTDIGNKYAITGLSRQFYRDIGRHYGELENWQFEPHVAGQVFRDYLEKANIKPLLYYSIRKVIKQEGRIHEIILSPRAPGSGKTATTDITIRAKVFIDCSYEGDLMALAGVSYTVGRESNRQYDETYNGVQLSVYHQFPDGIDPYIIKGDPSSGLLWGIAGGTLEPAGSGDNKVQAYNFRICLTDSAENLMPVTRPENYDSGRYALLLRLIEHSEVKDLYEYFIWSRMPGRKTDINNGGAFSTDYIGMNWNYPEAGNDEQAQIISDHKDYTLGLLYFLGNDPRVPGEIRSEMQKWGLPLDEYLGTGHFSPQLYIREARRMTGTYVMTEHNCTGEVMVDDGVGLAAYTMDSHNCQRLVVNGMVKNEGDVEIGGFPPYPVSYRALLPKRDECTNLLVPVCLSASHIAFGSIRMEPVFMVLGQSAAIAASIAIDSDIPVQDVNAASIQSVNKNDPLLDHTPPDIIIDNCDTALFRVSGNWITIPTNWENKGYAADFVMKDTSAAGQGIVTFSFTVPLSDTYSLYYYCPDLSSYGKNKNITEEIPCLLTYEGRTKKISVPFRDYPGKWSPCGEYLFDPGKIYSLVVDAGKLPGLVAADAILLIKSHAQ